ncbi:MAG: sulfite exporter TauE/SafE family protein [Thermodesulfovibrionales bacterium]
MLAAAIIFLASALQRAFGFAFVLVAMPLLSLFIEIRTVAPLIALFLPLVTGILAFRMRVSFDLRKVLPLVAGAAAGIPLGIFFLVTYSDRLIKGVLGAVIVAYSAWSLLAGSLPWQAPSWTSYGFGFLAGSMGGAFNTSGPPAVFYVSSQRWAKAETVASLNFFIFATSVLVLFFHLASGNVTAAIALTFMKLLPPMAAGMAAGSYIFGRLDEGKYRKGLFALLFVMGLILVAR